MKKNCYLLKTNQQKLKKIVDILFGTIGFLIFLIVCLIVIIPIKRDGGPLFFKQKRVGKNNKLFTIYKFRSMELDAEKKLRHMLAKDMKIRNEYYSTFKLKDDPRITKIGKFLRKTSLDEFPQFFNVLRGDMSIVGPRPVLPKEAEIYYSNPEGVEILKAKPGVTGLWQITGRSDVEDYGERLKLDTEYIEEWSIFLDIKIIIKTFEKVIRMKGAY